VATSQVYSSFVTSAVTVTTTTETVVATVVVPATPSGGGKVVIDGWCQLTLGTGTTAVTPRIRRGTTITGTLIGVATATGAAQTAITTEDIEIHVDDTPGEAVNISYVLTVQQTGAGANGSAVQAEIKATVVGN
jgi:hypothetical protein